MFEVENKPENPRNDLSYNQDMFDHSPLKVNLNDLGGSFKSSFGTLTKVNFNPSGRKSISESSILGKNHNSVESLE